MRPEIQEYFRSVAEQYRVVEHVRFHSIVEKAVWDDTDKVWVVTVLDLKTKQQTIRRAKVLVSGVGSLSVPKQCDIPGADTFKGKMFHSAQWDHTFDWNDKDVVVLGTHPSLIAPLLHTHSSRKRLFSYPISPYHGQSPQPRPPHHPIRTASPISL
jgi:cation diffusion facilitator CzcD-associated flavoprotein CzcO